MNSKTAQTHVKRRCCRAFPSDVRPQTLGNVPQTVTLKPGSGGGRNYTNALPQSQWVLVSWPGTELV